MAKILGRQTMIDRLKAGAKIWGSPLLGWRLGEIPEYKLYAGKPGGNIANIPTIRDDMLTDLLQEGLISQEVTGNINSFIFRWRPEIKKKEEECVVDRKFTCANIVFETRWAGLYYYCGKRRKEFPDNCNECQKYKKVVVNRGAH